MCIIQYLIAGSCSPHTAGEELILAAVSEVQNTALNRSAEQIIKVISQSDKSVLRRVDEIAENTKDTVQHP